MTPDVAKLYMIPKLKSFFLELYMAFLHSHVFERTVLILFGYLYVPVQKTLCCASWWEGFFISGGIFMDSGIISVSSITIICYLIAQGVKATSLNNKWLPVICGGCGAALGFFGQMLLPDFPAGDIITALAVGVLSGLAATGSHQLIKQLGGMATDED